jgi:hypothetical protein
MSVSKTIYISCNVKTVKRYIGKDLEVMIFILMDGTTLSAVAWNNYGNQEKLLGQTMSRPIFQKGAS